MSRKSPIVASNDYAALAGFGSERVATIIENGAITAFRPAEQAAQARFANTWAANIREQGFTTARVRR